MNSYKPEINDEVTRPIENWEAFSKNLPDKDKVLTSEVYAIIESAFKDGVFEAEEGCRLNSVEEELALDIFEPYMRIVSEASVPQSQSDNVSIDDIIDLLRGDGSGNLAFIYKKFASLHEYFNSLSAEKTSDIVKRFDEDNEKRILNSKAQVKAACKNNVDLTYAADTVNRIIDHTAETLTILEKMHEYEQKKNKNGVVR